MSKNNTVEFVMAAIKLKALGVITSADGTAYPAVDFMALGKQLRQAGALDSMLAYAAATSQVTIQSVWLSTPEAIKILRRMRLEAAQIIER